MKFLILSKHSSLSDEPKIADVLIHNGTNINIQNDDGETPLFWAAKGGESNESKYISTQKLRIKILNLNIH